MRAALARMAVLAGAGLLFVVVVLLALLPGKGADQAGGAHTSGPEGWRALVLLCERLGFPVVAWDGAPGELAGAGNVLVLGAVPGLPPGGPRAPDAPLGARDPAHYARFVAEGGTVLVLCDEPDEWDELVEVCGRGGPIPVTAEGRVRSELALEFAGGETFALAPGAFVTWSGVGLTELAGATLPVLETRTLDVVDGEPPVELEAEEASEPERVTVAARFPLGPGALVLVGLEPATFSNRALESAPDAALLFVRLLEACGPAQRILFDQYALGSFVPPSRLELLLSPGLAAASLHLVAWFVLFLAAVAWVGPFARDPEPLLAGAPLARARGQGGLYLRARRFDLLAGLLRRGLLERWNARAGLRASGVEADLARLARGDARWLARARELVLGPAPVDARDLEALARSLAVLERELFRAPTASVPGRHPRSRSHRSP